MAITTSNLQALAAAWGVGNEYQPIVVDLLKRSSLLQTATVAKASHGIKHKFRYFNSFIASVPIPVFLLFFGTMIFDNVI